MRLIIKFPILLLLFAVPMQRVLSYSPEEIDHSRPYPLSLQEYPILDNPADPWAILDVDNIRVNSDNSGQLQNEEMVCINPTNTANAVALWRDFRLGYRRIGVGYTFDGGQTWSDTLLVVHDMQCFPGESGVRV